MASQERTLLINKKAYHEYHVIEDFIAGIQLVGPEVKSVRMTNVSVKEAYCLFIDGELFVRSMHISEYKEGTYNNVNPLRDRKLLLTKKELLKLTREVQNTGVTIVPLSLFITKTGKIKLKIGLVKGKKSFDKRETLKREDLKRELNINLK